MSDQTNCFIRRDDIAQGTDSWHEWRSSVIGSSDAPVIMGENPWKSAKALVEEKLAACRTCVTNASESLRCFTKDGSRSPEVGLQELTSNHPVLLRTKGAVVSDCGKGIVKDVR